MEKNKITQSIENLKNKPEPDTEVDKIWEALINPERSMEVKSWLMKNQAAGALLRGKNGETMLHWAVLSEYALIIDLLDYLDINELDNNKRTPMDWIIDRYNYVFNNRDKLDYIKDEGFKKIKEQTEHLGILTLNLGGKPYQLLDKDNEEKEPTKHYGIIACFGGLWWFLREIYYKYGKEMLTNWLDDKRSALHLWFQSPYDDKKNDRYDTLVKEFKLDINLEDLNKRTPLWYAIDGFFYSKYMLLEEPQNKNIITSIEQLLKLGADPNIADINNVTPVKLFDIYKEKIKKIMMLFKEYIENDEQLIKEEKIKELNKLGVLTEGENINNLVEKYNNLVSELDIDIDIIKFFMETKHE